MSHARHDAKCPVYIISFNHHSNLLSLVQCCVHVYKWSKEVRHRSTLHGYPASGQVGTARQMFCVESPHLPLHFLPDGSGGLGFFCLSYWRDNCSNDQVYCDINSPWKCNLIMFGKLNVWFLWMQFLIDLQMTLFGAAPIGLCVLLQSMPLVLPSAHWSCFLWGYFNHVLWK